MGFWKSAGKVLNKVKDVALPVIGTAIAGPAGGAIGGALAGGIGHGKPTLKRVGMGAAGGALGGMLGGGQAGAKAMLGSAGKAFTSPSAALSLAKNVAGGSMGSAPGAAAGASGGGFLNGLADNADLVVGGLSLLQGQKQDKRASRLQDQAMAMQQARDAELAPIRQAGIRRLMDAQRPDLSSDFQSANPFARPLRRIG